MTSFLYVLFIFFSIHELVEPLEYIGILLCLGFSFLIYKKSIDTWIVRTALFITAIADIFLLLLNGYELIGVSIFTIVQLIYGFRLMIMKKSKILIKLSIRLTLIVLFQIIAFIIIDHIDLLTIVTFFYFSNLFTNVLFAFYQYNINKIFAIGLFLLLCCDIFVGLNNSQGYIDITQTSMINKLLHLPIDLMWFFYYPSQVLITMSILTTKNKI